MLPNSRPKVTMSSRRTVRARFAGERPLRKCFNFLDAVQILRDSETHRVRRGPEHPSQSLRVVGHKRSFVFRIEGLQLSHDFGVIN